MDFQKNLEKYAELAVKVGVNIQPGQTLVINASLDAVHLVRLIVEKAYQTGAKHVFIDWEDEVCTRLKYDLAPEEAFTEYPAWRAAAQEELAKEGAAFLHIMSSDPELLKGVSPSRLSAYSKASRMALQKYREYILSDKVSWSIIAAPSAVWAMKVFPELDKEAAVEALWNAIFQAVRIGHDDPVTAWKEHIETLNQKMNYLNNKQYTKLHYSAFGTDLTVELPLKHIWQTGAAINQKGVRFIANIPTEEVYTSPLKNGTNGVVRSSKPLSYNGNIIDNFSLEFKDGRVVGYEAETGYETLKTMIEMDEGSHYLGEIALVPHDSPISNSNLIFINTLFDENASNHLALGTGFATCIENGTSMSNEELQAAGVNQSLIHVDFMIGSAQMDIDGETADGEREPIFRQGNWAF